MTKMNAAHSRDHATSGSHAGATAGVVSMSDLLERRVPLEWYESVAVVAGLCTALNERRATGMPSPRDITLTPQGTIAINGRDAHEFVALPRLLHELLGMTTPPTPLRLLVLHTISSDVDKSPSAFGAALAYYERPGRETWIQSARQRCLETPVPNHASDQPTLSELFDMKMAAEARNVVTAKKASARNPRRGRAVVATLATAVAVTGLVIAVSYRSGNATVVNGVTAARAMAAHVTAAGRGFAQSVAAQLTGTNATHETSTAAATPQAAEPSRAVRAKHAAHGETPATVSGDASVAVAPLAPSPDSTDDDSSDADATTARTIAERTPEPEANAIQPIARHEIPDGVVPPRLLDPIRLPSWAQEGTTAESQNVIQLDIANDGTVERVKLISPTMRLTDMMILSAAKTWIFEPASDGGHPIPYRMTLNWVPPAR